MKGGFWPSPSQERLLELALGDPARAPTLWRELRASMQLEKLEPGSFALLPLVYRALEQGNGDDADLLRLKGIYRSTWVKNNVLLERAFETFAALVDAGVQALLLGGLGSGIRFYGDPALRPTTTIELLIAPAARTAAVASLQRVGWIPEPTGTPLWLTDGGGRACVLKTSLARDFDDEPSLFELNDTVGLRGTVLPVLAPGDELLAACVMGARASRYRTIQWIPDAALAVRTIGERIDWDRLIELSIAHHHTLRVRDAIAYVARLPGVRVPGDVHQRLAAGSVAPRVRLAHSIAARSARGQQLGARFRLPRKGGTG